MAETQGDENSVKNRRARGNKMTRENAKQMLVGFGVAEPTDEQVNDLLNKIGAETKREKDRADGYRKDADKAIELQKQLDELNAQNMTDIEKANKATETANKQIADLQKELAQMKLAKNLADKGITGDDANAFIKAISDGDYTAMTEVLGNVISAREVASANAKEKELLNNTPNPSGNGKGQAAEKSTAERIVANMISSNPKTDTSILSNYINK